MPQRTPDLAPDSNCMAISCAGAAFDRQAVLRLVDDDVGLLQEVIAIFLEESPGDLLAVEDAIQEHDGSKLQMSAHKLKGSASSFSSPATFAAAQVLEELGRTADFTHVLTAQRRLEAALLHLQQALRAFSTEYSS